MKTDDYNLQCQAGRTAAAAVLDDARLTGSPLPIVRAVQEMIRRGELTGLETSFLFEIAEAIRSD